jgi:hypothetical protein
VPANVVLRVVDLGERLREQLEQRERPLQGGVRIDADLGRQDPLGDLAQPVGDLGRAVAAGRRCSGGRLKPQSREQRPVLGLLQDRGETPREMLGHLAALRLGRTFELASERAAQLLPGHAVLGVQCIEVVAI